MSAKCVELFTNPRTLDYMLPNSLDIVYELPEEHDQNTHYPMPRLRPNRYSAALRPEEIQHQH